MTWRVELLPRTVKQLNKLDKPTTRRITDYLRETANGEDPRSRGKGLTNSLTGSWRYRVGNYRIIASIEDDESLILAIRIDHRSQIHRQLTERRSS